MINCRYIIRTFGPNGPKVRRWLHDNKIECIGYMNDNFGKLYTEHIDADDLTYLTLLCDIVVEEINIDNELAI